MVAVSAGSATDKVIISDNEVPADGRFWIGLNPEKIPGPIKQPMIGFVSTAADQSVGTHIGETQILFTFLNIPYPKDGTGGDWEKLLRAIASWGSNDNNDLLYLQVKDQDGYNIAKWSNAAFDGVAQIRGKINGFPQVDWATPNYYYFNLQFVRLTVG